MRFLCVLAAGAIACSSTTAVDDVEPDASFLDHSLGKATSAMDVTKTDAPIDSPVDTGGDDATKDDAGDDAGFDANPPPLDAGPPDGSICPLCMKGFSCCTIMKSMNYGKCTDNKCLACCM